jgi:hypothetical protein
MDVECFFKNEVYSSLFNSYIPEIKSKEYKVCENRHDNKAKHRQGTQASSGVPSMASPGSLPDPSPSMRATDEVDSLR